MKKIITLRFYVESLITIKLDSLGLGNCAPHLYKYSFKPSFKPGIKLVHKISVSRDYHFLYYLLKRLYSSENFLMRAQDFPLFYGLTFILKSMRNESRNLLKYMTLISQLIAILKL